MAKKQSKSARIRKLLAQGKSVKQITAMLDVTPQFVYTIRAQEKKQLEKSGFDAAPIKKEGAPIRYDQSWKIVAVHTAPPRPSLWARVKSFFGA